MPSSTLSSSLSLMLRDFQQPTRFAYCLLIVSSICLGVQHRGLSSSMALRQSATTCSSHATSTACCSCRPFAPPAFSFFFFFFKAILVFKSEFTFGAFFGSRRGDVGEFDRDGVGDMLLR